MNKRAFSALSLATTLVALGCNSATLVAAPLATDQNGATSLVVNGAYLYWGMPDGTIRRVANDGGSKVETIASGLKTPTSLVVDDNNVYFVESDGDIGRVNKTGGVPTVLALSQPGTVGMASDGAQLFWAKNNGEVSKVPVDGGDVETITSMANTPTGLGRQGATLYLTTGSAGAVAPDNSATGALIATSADGAASTEATIVQNLTVPTQLTVTTKSAFWADLDPDAMATDSHPVIGTQLINATGLEGAELQDATLRNVSSNFRNINALTSDEDNVYVASDDLDSATIDPKTKEIVIHHTKLVSVASTGGDPEAMVIGPPSPMHVSSDNVTVYWIYPSDGLIVSATKNAATTTTPEM